MSLDNMKACESRQYSDASVQTSPIASATRDQDFSDVKATPASRSVKRVTYVDQATAGAYYDDSHSRRVYPRTPINRMKTHLPLNRPNQILNLSTGTEEQRRVFSLPEQVVTDLLSRKLANSLISCSRTVSMPAAIQHFPQGALAYEKSLTTNISPSISYEEDSSHLQRYTQINDLPRTPALELTPDSIEIFDGSFCSDTYFHGGQVNAPKALNKDWHAWSSSPPRPIPALHGPSSLPYARCPSGAEGTIIEEPSSVPCLIWGLKDCASSALSERNAAEHGNQGIPLCSSMTQECRKADTSDRRSSAVHHPQEQFLVDSHHDISAARNDHPSVQYEASIRNGNPKRELLQNGGLNYNRSTNEHSSSQPNNSRNPHERLISVTAQQQVPQQHVCFPRSVLINRERNGHSVHLDEAAPGLISVDSHGTFVQLGTNDTLGVKTRQTSEADRSGAREYCIRTRRLRRDHVVPADLPLTPPDSTSPIWSSEHSPLLMDSLFPLQQQSHLGTSHPFSTQIQGLNLHAPTESIESLSEQLKRLILRQQTNHEAGATSQEYDHGTTHNPNRNQVSALPLRPRSSTLPDSRKPEMPINLHDLVVRHIQDSSPNSGAIISSKSEFVTSPEPASTATCQKPTTVLANVNDMLVPKDVMSGRRNLRSIPFARLLEKRLAPVPEETSFGGDISVSLSHPSVASPLTSSEKDYDFAELRSPLEETMTNKSHNIPDEASERPNQRIALKLLKQRKRQLKRKEPADAKASPNKSTEHRSDQNDENVYNPNPPTTTLRRKSKTVNKRGTAVTSVKRVFGTQKPRRKA